ncbi:pyruvate dehydrogenase E2 component (dihydrolipoamide acetyltransferase) [Catalinimonas alkaloidigena]|uniref:2-oxo acid dehydrogenase subunit E2 n=1 Tax=Catalinimonas alkaloidigena TaxID=1075417 RepID=UPI002404FB10|nr:2-oxo acid dehydrogenase subunit E2 [Catalinimonas alkaloidigena]MDF9797439.1 pyruvate dehydrogenase E2 component (dihydrolipoamide acetyltransferase) [Catalinimonas alkaloidigena]
MAKEIKMPQISEDAESGTIVEVMVSEGDTIEEEQSIIAVESDKASVEVPAEAGGKVKEIKVSEGDEINVGDVILILEAGENGEDDQAEDEEQEEKEDEQPEGKKKEKAEEEEEDDGDTEAKEKDPKEEVDKDEVEDEENEDADRKEKDKEAEGKNKKEANKKGEVPAAPSVRRMAREMNVDIYAVKGTGPGERITADDVKAAADGKSGDQKKSASEQSQESSLPDFSQWGEIERKKMSGIRKATAKSMGNAWRTVPHVTQFDKANISTLQDFMEQYEAKAAKAGAKLTVTAVLVKLSASALRAFPKFNASVDIENQEIIYKKYINIGVAVDTENGLLVPVIRDADRKSVTSIALELGEIAEKAREGKLSMDEMKGGNFTVSNLGGIGGTNFTPIVYHPQVAILGVSRNQIEPVYEDGEFKPKTMLPLSLSYDHRAIDGAEAARFLRWMCQVMEDPFVMLMEGGI